MLKVIEQPGQDALIRVADATRAVVSWNSDAPAGAVALIAHRIDGSVSNPLRYARWTPEERHSFASSDGTTRVEIDVLRSELPLAGIGIASTVALDAVAVATPPLPGPRAPAPGRVTPLDVPELSQYTREHPDERGWCSAAALAMLLRFHGRDADVASVARAVFDSAYNGTGNWTFNAAYAGARGLRGVIAHLRDIDHVATFVEAGFPVAISISWQPGQLPGAPLDASDGHLIVVRGIELDAVLVNDPAQPAVAAVYPRAALDALFREHGGVAYLVAPRPRTAELVALANGVEAAAR